MGYNDALGKFSDSQALTGTGAVSTNVIDMTGAFGYGTGEPLAVQINVIVAADVADADETYTFSLQSGSTATPTDIIATVGFGGTNELVRGTLTAGFQVVLTIPPGTTVGRFLRLNYVLGGTTPTITCSAYLKPVSMITNNFQDGHQDDKTIV